MAAPITERRAIFCLRQNAFKLYASWLFDLLACQSLILLVRRNTEIPIFVILLGHDSGGTAETLGGWGGDDALASALSDDAEPPRILE